MSDSRRIHLLAVDPQNDFCDIPSDEQPADPLAPGRRTAPALPVAGADADMKRLAAFIDHAGDRLAAIHVTLDSHNVVDVAHPVWWVDAEGRHPAPFTAIPAKDVHAGRWRATDPALQARSRDYVDALEASGRYTLVVWPEHCLIGHWGHNVHPAVAAALDRWARARNRVVDFVTKGTNPYTEHYSAVRAEVPDPADPGTHLNVRLIETLVEADEMIIAGEALSHCVANTVRDIAANFGAENVKKLVLLEDCSSAVAGFEKLGADFVAEMKARGMRTARSTSLFG